MQKQVEMKIKTHRKSSTGSNVPSVLNWLHELCLPQGYCFTRDDDDFVCPN